MRLLDLFSGIGGFSYAARQVWGDDLEIVSFVERDPFCQKVLKKNFPGVPIHDDIKTYHPDRTIDLITGGFPCQPFSCAGKRAGKEDDRYLWPEMLRVISEARPRWIIGENVAGIVNMALDQVCLDLENEGYQVQPFVVPAAGVNAPHRRDRVWIVANAKGERGGGKPETVRGEERGQEHELLPDFINANSHVAHADSTGLQERRSQAIGKMEGSIKDRETAMHIGAKTEEPNSHAPDCPCDRLEERGLVQHENQGGQSAGSDVDAPDTSIPFLESQWPEHAGEQLCGTGGGEHWNEDWYSVALRTCVRDVDDGLPAGVVRPKGWRVNALKALGNSIVPAVAVEIFRALKRIEGRINGKD